MSKKKLFIGVSIIIIIAWALWYFNNWLQEPVMPSKENIIKLDFINVNKTLYLKAKVWGLNGNHQEITLSESIETGSDKKLDYIFYTSVVYYKTNMDSVVLFAPASSISEPAKKFANLHVEVKPLKSMQEMQKYEANYKVYGLKRIGVYDSL